VQQQAPSQGMSTRVATAVCNTHQCAPPRTRQTIVDWRICCDAPLSVIEMWRRRCIRSQFRSCGCCRLRGCAPQLTTCTLYVVTPTVPLLHRCSDGASTNAEHNNNVHSRTAEHYINSRRLAGPAGMLRQSVWPVTGLRAVRLDWPVSTGMLNITCQPVRRAGEDPRRGIVKLH